MGYQLITNGQPRPLVSREYLPESVQLDFDYVSEDDYSERFFCYRGEWHDAQDMQSIAFETARPSLRMGWACIVHPGEPLARFDALKTDSFFSGLAIRFVDDGESVIVARYYS